MLGATEHRCLLWPVGASVPGLAVLEGAEGSCQAAASQGQPWGNIFPVAAGTGELSPCHGAASCCPVRQGVSQSQAGLGCGPGYLSLCVGQRGSGGPGLAGSVHTHACTHAHAWTHTQPLSAGAQRSFSTRSCGIPGATGHQPREACLGGRHDSRISQAGCDPFRDSLNKVERAQASVSPSLLPQLLRSRLGKPRG